MQFLTVFQQEAVHITTVITRDITVSIRSMAENTPSTEDIPNMADMDVTVDITVQPDTKPKAQKNRHSATKQLIMLKTQQRLLSKQKPPSKTKRKTNKKISGIPEIF